MKFWQPFHIASQFPLNICKRTPLGMSFLKAQKVNLIYALFESPCGLPVSNQRDKYPWTLNFCSLSGCGLVDMGFYNTSLVLKKSLVNATLSLYQEHISDASPLMENSYKVAATGCSLLLYVTCLRFWGIK